MVIGVVIMQGTPIWATVLATVVFGIAIAIAVNKYGSTKETNE